jgi:signal transduction histidine kinase
MSSAVTGGRVPREFALAERVGERNERRRVDAERLRLARELHDIVAYGFATINIQAGVAAHVLDQRPEQVVDALQAIKAASKVALEELRAVLGMLRQADAPRDSAPGIRQLDGLVRTANNAGVPTSLNVVGSQRDVPAAIDQAAYRIVQEALTNVLCHAGPASASVSVTFERHRLLISIEDDGRGNESSAEHVSPGSGYGIVGMRERATALGGDLEAAPLPASGFRVSASLPLPADS